jgi:hypothetical protein
MRTDEVCSVAKEGMEGKKFFFEKKNQKTFTYMVRALRHRAHLISKSFLVFFSKKNALLNPEFCHRVVNPSMFCRIEDHEQNKRRLITEMLRIGIRYAPGARVSRALRRPWH